MSSFIARAQSFLTGTPFPVPELDHFVDVVGVHRANVNAVAGAGIAVGDGVSRFLPRFPVRRDQVASFLARTLAVAHDADLIAPAGRSEEHTSELQSLMRISYAVFCLKKKKNSTNQ